MIVIDKDSHHGRAFKSRPDFGDPPFAIVLHSGEGTRASDLETLTGPDVSAHFYVTRDATVFQLVDEHKAAFHAGASHYLGLGGWNAFSIGIETEHRAGQNWPQEQLDAWAELVKDLIARFGVRREMIVAHRWIAVPRDRRADPTNRSDHDLRQWITGFFPHPEGHLFRVIRASALVRTGPGREHDVALQGRAVLEVNDVIEVDRTVDGTPVDGNPTWMHRANGDGFVHSSLLERLEF